MDILYYSVLVIPWAILASIIQRVLSSFPNSRLLKYWPEIFGSLTLPVVASYIQPHALYHDENIINLGSVGILTLFGLAFIAPVYACFLFLRLIDCLKRNDAVLLDHSP